MSDEPNLLPFKKGAFHLAVQSGCPIIPVVCENYSKLLKKGKYFKRGTLKMKGEFWIHVLDLGILHSDSPDRH